MNNIVNFDEFESERQIGIHQQGLPRVILEGRDDVQLFENWFQHMLDSLEFVEADDVVRGGGCTSVANAVVHSRDKEGVPAIGVVDRDTLFRNKRWPMLFTRDDALFQAAHTDDVLTASLWEVEAYLLRPDLLSDWVAARRHELPAPPELCAGAVAAAVEECEALLDAAPVIASAHAAGARIENGWGAHLGSGELGAAFAQEFTAALASHNDVAHEVAALVADVRAHAPEDLANRLIYYLRYVDTKRLLTRLNARLGLKGAAHWALAPFMVRESYSPPELERIVAAHAERWAA